MERSEELENITELRSAVFETLSREAPGVVVTQHVIGHKEARSNGIVQVLAEIAPGSSFVSYDNAIKPRLRMLPLK